MTLIIHGGRACAVATNAGVVYAPEVSSLEPDHPRRRFVGALCLYARDVRVGAVPGPYDAEEAAFYARTLLVDNERFELLARLCDAELAEHFSVPLEQVSL